MKLSAEEIRFLTALLREQTQSGSRGPAHQLLREHGYPEAPASGLKSLAFTYAANSLTTLLLDGMDLQEIDEFLRRQEAVTIAWPWPSPEAYRARLAEARKEWTVREETATHLPPNGVDGSKRGQLQSSSKATP